MTLEIDDCCNRYEDALQSQERPNLADWLASMPIAQAELVALDLHYRLLRGESATAAEYFAKYPQLFQNTVVAIRLVGIEYRAVVARNAAITEHDFRERYPVLAATPEWNNGLWRDENRSRHDTHTTLQQQPTETVSGHRRPDVADTGTMIQQLPSKVAKPPSDPADFPLNILEPAHPEHPQDLGRLGEYRIVGIVGKGGMGAVLEGVNAISGHPVAIKVMLPDEAKRAGARERFLREARVAQKIDHPRVVPIYHVGESHGSPYLVMKLLKGVSLGQRFEHGPPLTITQIVQLTREIAEGLQAAHRLGLVHRDLKPDNIWLERTADGDHVRILDFGLARPISGEDSLTQSGMIVGTPAYMSPEQADGGEVDARTDLWSLGVVVYRLVSREFPFGDAPLTKVLKAIALHTPKPLAEVAPNTPTRLSQLVERLLAKSLSERPVNAEEVIRELTAIETENTNNPSERSTVELPEPRRKPQVVLSCSITVALMLIVTIGVVTQFGGGNAGFGPVASKVPADSRLQASPPLAKVQPQPDPLRVKFINLNHFAVTANGKGISSGVIGKESFDVTLGDQVTVDVELNGEAYCYLVAFRPDGVAEVIYPEDANEVPAKTDRPRYPSKSRGVNYGLTDGTGLWVLAVVVSETPLKSFADATAGKPIPKLAGGESLASALWWDDGAKVVPLTRIPDRGTRGASSTLPGQSQVAAVTTWMKSLAGPTTTAASIGFMVQPKKQ